MKWIPKLSVISLVIPLVTGITLFSSGCKCKGGTETLKVPEVIQGAKFSSDSHASAQDWIKSLDDNVKKVNALNNILVNDSKLNADYVESILFELDKTNTACLVKVILRNGYEFASKHEWVLSTPIPFQPIQVIDEPVVHDQIGDMNNTFEAWIDATNKKSIDEKTRILFKRHPSVNAIDTIKLAGTGNANRFKINVILKEGFMFNKKRIPEWTSEETIFNFYDAEIDVPDLVDTAKQIKEHFLSFDEWKTKKLTSLDGKFNAFFNRTSYRHFDKINAINVIKTYENKFDVEITLKGNSCFKQEGIYTNNFVIKDWEFYTIHDVPEIFDAMVEETEPDVQTWWNNIGDDLKYKTEILNSLLTNKATINISWVQDINITLREVSTKFQMVVKLKKGHLFDNQSTLALGDIFYFRKAFEFPMDFHKNMSGRQANAKDWVAEFNQKSNQEKINILSITYMPADQIKDFFLCIPNEEKPNVMMAEVTLNDDVGTPGNKRSFRSGEIIYQKGTGIPSPTSVSPKEIIAKEESNYKWFQTVGSDHSVFKRFFGNTYPHIDKLKDMFLYGLTIKFTLVVVLNNGFFFEDTNASTYASMGWKYLRDQSSQNANDHEQPVQEQPIQEQPAHEQPVQEQQPAQEQPIQQQPAHEQPAHEQPAQQQPVHEQPAQQQPAQQQPSHGQLRKERAKQRRQQRASR